MTVVFDTSVVVSAVFWPASTARRALAAVARRRAQMAVTAAVLAEYELTLAEVGLRFPEMNWRGSLAYIKTKAVQVVAAPIGKARSRDPKDDVMLACALSAGAQFVVSSDRDLLVLEKPFGVSIVTPVEFLRAVG